MLSQMTLLRGLTFLLKSLNVSLMAPPFWISFFLLTLVFVPQWYSLHWEILIILLPQFPLTQNEMSHFMAPWDDIFNVSASAAAKEFCEWVQVGIDLDIPHCKSQVKPHSYHGFQLLLLVP